MQFLTCIFVRYLIMDAFENVKEFSPPHHQEEQLNEEEDEEDDTDDDDEDEEEEESGEDDDDEELGEDEGFNLFSFFLFAHIL